MMVSKEGQDMFDNNFHDGRQIEWAPLSITLVEYPKGDLLGKLFAFISLAPFGIGAGFIALILFRRDLHTITFFIGTLVNEAVNVVLKHTIREARPVFRDSLYGEYGMPSSHSQFMWFFTAYIIYFVFIRLQHINNKSILSRVWIAGVVAGVVGGAAAVSVARVYLLYHSAKQVGVGAAVGVVVATLWFALTHCILTPLFPHIVCWRISELLLLRDTTLIPNVLWFEYTSSRQEARARSRKLVPLKAQ